MIISLFICWTTHSNLTGFAAGMLWRHPSNMNAIKRILIILLSNQNCTSGRIRHKWPPPQVTAVYHILPSGCTLTLPQIGNFGVPCGLTFRHFGTKVLVKLVSEKPIELWPISAIHYDINHVWRKTPWYNDEKVYNCSYLLGNTDWNTFKKLTTEFILPSYKWKLTQQYSPPQSRFLK